MTLTELIARVRKHIDDQTDGTVTNTDITGFINEAYLALSKAYGIATPLTVSVVAATQEYALPTDFLRVITVRKNATTDTVAVTLYPVDQDSTTEGYYLTEDAKIGFTPLPTVAFTVTLTYAKRPEKLVGLSDIPLLPEEYHTYIANFAAGRAQEADGMKGDATYWYTQYQAGLNEATTHGKTRGKSSFRTRVVY